MVSHRLEPEVAESKYFFNLNVKFLLILTLAVSDGGSNPLAPTPLTYRDSEESLVHYYPDTQVAPEPTRKEPHERKRKETPVTASTETIVVTKKIKTEGSGYRGRIRQADFDELTRSIIEETISIYRAQIGSVEPFPDRADDRDTVKQAWLEVCTSRNLRVELEEDIFKLVSDCSCFLDFADMISSYRLLDGLHKQEGLRRQPLSHILYRRTTSTALDQNAKFVTKLNNFWKDFGLFTR